MSAPRPEFGTKAQPNSPGGRRGACPESFNFSLRINLSKDQFVVAGVIIRRLLQVGKLQASRWRAGGGLGGGGGGGRTGGLGGGGAGGEEQGHRNACNKNAPSPSAMPYLFLPHHSHLLLHPQTVLSVHLIVRTDVNQDDHIFA